MGETNTQTNDLHEVPWISGFPHGDQVAIQSEWNTKLDDRWYAHLYGRNGGQTTLPVGQYLIDPTGLRGGAHGGVYGDLLEIYTMFIDKELRGLGYGTRLLENIEKEAISKGAKISLVQCILKDSYQFYIKNTYSHAGHISGCPGPNDIRYFLLKKLVSS